MSYDPVLPPDPNNPWDPRNAADHPENPRNKDKGSTGLPVPDAGGIILLAILYLILLLSVAAAISAAVAAPVLRYFGKFYEWEEPPLIAAMVASGQFKEIFQYF